MSESREKWLAALSDGLSERDRQLIDRASQLLEDNILQPENGKTLPWSPLRGIVPSPGNYRGIWNWDSAFHMLAVGRWDKDLAYEQVKILLENQLPSGLLPDVVFADGKVVDSFGKPPVFPWVCYTVDYYNRVSDIEFLRYCHEHFKPYESFWRRERGGDADGLFHYDSKTKGLEHDKEAKFESGWDTSVRWDSGIDSIWPIDLNCYIAMMYDSLWEMAHMLMVDDDEVWSDRYDAVVEQINNILWDDDLGVYCDVYRDSKKSTGVLSPASFMPLFAGIATKERAKRMHELAADPNKFYPGMPTVSYDNPEYSSSDYWRGPTWLNTAYFAAKGLKGYGYTETASTIRETILNWCSMNTDTIYEYYDSRTGKGLGAEQFGWSAAFIIEFVLNW